MITCLGKSGFYFLFIFFFFVFYTSLWKTLSTCVCASFIFGLKSGMLDLIVVKSGPEVIILFFMLNLVELEIFPAHKC